MVMKASVEDDDSGWELGIPDKMEKSNTDWVDITQDFEEACRGELWSCSVKNLNPWRTEDCFFVSVNSLTHIQAPNKETAMILCFPVFNTLQGWKYEKNLVLLLRCINIDFCCALCCSMCFCVFSVVCLFVLLRVLSVSY